MPTEGLILSRHMYTLVDSKGMRILKTFFQKNPLVVLNWRCQLTYKISRVSDVQKSMFTVRK